MKKYEYTIGMNGNATYFLITFGLSLMLGMLIFILGKGKRTVARSNSVYNGGEKIKLIPYSCGEYMLYDVRSRIDLERFMIYAIYFLIFDVAAFILALSFNLLVLAVIGYSIVVLASIMLVAKR